MVTRFTDDMTGNTEGSDFIVRKRGPLSIQLLAIFGIAYIVIYFTASVMQEMGSKTLFIATLTAVISALTWFTMFFSSRHRDLLLATEFQNAILASATQLATRFCFIVKSDGVIVYIDPGFQKVFPQFMNSTNRTVYDLLTVTGMPEDIKKSVTDALGHNEGGNLVLPLTDASRIPLPMMVTIDVLARPRGYFLLRGRDYVQKRAEGTGSDAVTAHLLAQALSHMQEGVLTADDANAITYINPVLEGWLGYGNGEATLSGLTLTDLLQQSTGKATGQAAVPERFDGEAVFTCKGGTLLPLTIHRATLHKNDILQGTSIVASKSPGSNS